MTPDEWREAVGVHVERRRIERRFRSVRAAAKLAGVSEGAWRQVESGRRQVAKGVVQTTNPGADIQSGICRALRWSEDSIERLLRGEPPVVIPEDEAIGDPMARFDSRLARIEARQDELATAVDTLLGLLQAGLPAAPQAGEVVRPEQPT